MAEPMFQRPVDWAEWQAERERRGEVRVCADPDCRREFVPNHPRRLFCNGPGCRGRAPRKRRRHAGPTGRRQAAIRRAGVQGFLGEVIVASHSCDGADPREIVRQARAFAAAEAQRDSVAARAAAVALCAHAAARAVTLVPPLIEDPDDLD